MFLLLNVQVNIDIVLVARITESNEYGIGPIPSPVVVKCSQDICDCNILRCGVLHLHITKAAWEPENHRREARRCCGEGVEVLPMRLWED